MPPDSPPPASPRPALLGKLLYGSLFTLLLPALLILWARALSPQLNLPTVHWPLIGPAIALLGAWLIAHAMLALWVHGGGLPMNAFPPPRLVTRGPYRLTHHPIYAGFCILWIGAALAVGSPAALWFISPILILACAALVLGYEGPSLRRRFGNDRPAPLLRLPPSDTSRPTPRDHLGVALLVVLPWLILYEAVGHLRPGDVLIAYFPFEQRWPVLPWTEPIYAATYPFVLLAPLAARTRARLRQFCLTALLATAAAMIIYLTIPLIAPPRPFTPTGPLGRLLMLERADGLEGHAAFPCFHLLWALIAARLYAQRSRPTAVAAYALAALIGLSCITTGMHALADLAATLALFPILLAAPTLWSLLRRACEHTANSWRERRLGPVRIINHALYAGLAALTGLAIAATLAGPDNLAPLALCTLLALAGAALWGQLVVGSPSLLRPFGYFGFILGAVAGILAAAPLSTDPWLLAAAAAAAAPWAQAIGRLRCLVQGCCHGRPTTHPALGIRYNHPRSRVTRLTPFADTPLHPTPLYSILANLLIGVLLARLWTLHAPLPMIVGLYLLLSGIARFIEESYRGEPHTPTLAGLRLYQWLALACILLGAPLTAIPHQAPIPPPQPTPAGLLLALAGALLFAAAMSADFPTSNRRFSRLA